MITVRDIMATDVVSVAPDTSVRQLVRLMADEEISGAPVVDAAGTPVGVVSATDVLRLAADDVEIAVPPRGRTGEESPEPVETGDEEYDLIHYFWSVGSPQRPAELDFQELPETALDEVTVGEIMTSAVFDISPDASVAELAAFLLRGRIHRAVVVEDHRLVGIVTAFDVLRAVAEDDAGRETDGEDAS